MTGPFAHDDHPVPPFRQRQISDGPPPDESPYGFEMPPDPFAEEPLPPPWNEPPDGYFDE